MGRLAILALAAVALSGCAREQEAELPEPCRSGPEAVQVALRRAPAPVTLDGTPLSGCLARSGDPGEIQQVGGDFLAVTTVLAAQARREPESTEALRLGYLVGAVRRGATATQGFHSEMVRRIEQELLPIDTSSRAFRRGQRAGRSGG